MEPGQSKTVNIPPERAFGKPDPKKRQQFPCVRSMPRVVRLSAAEYTARYKAFPKMDQEVEWTPYFGAKIKEITDTDVALELLAKDGQQVEEPFGQALISANDQEVKITLTPRLGAPFEMQDQEGRIVASDGLSFTVDFNPPLAGKGAVVDLQVVGLTKASAFQDKTISWVEDHDAGLTAARSRQKPLVLVLYADWCNFCKRLFDETLQDPRIKAVHDDFVWLRINSDKEKRYHEQYQQNGFPLIVLMDQDGQVVKKIDGFRDAGAFRTELAALSAQRHAQLKQP
jgi:FKBP-type peptidyl-prolyl cis-trans isomerase 2